MISSSLLFMFWWEIESHSLFDVSCPTSSGKIPRKGLTHSRTLGLVPIHWSTLLRTVSKTALFLRVGGSLNCDQVLLRVVLPWLKATKSTVIFSNDTTQLFLWVNSIFPEPYEQAGCCPLLPLQYLTTMLGDVTSLELTLHLFFLSFVLHSFLSLLFFKIVIHTINMSSQNL